METEKIPTPEFVPYDTIGGRERYIACYKDAWRTAHGSLEGFSEDLCWHAARVRAADSPDSLTEMRVNGKFAGVLCLDDRAGRFRRIGWVAFCYVVPELRRRGLGRAMLDHAAAHYRARGRRALHLTVAPGNPALQFYEHLGFICIGSQPGALENLFLMEKKL